MIDPCRVVHSMACHRIALTAKSALFHGILAAHSEPDVEDIHVALVGDFDKAAAEEFLASFYDPQMIPDDLPKWLLQTHPIHDVQSLTRKRSRIDLSVTSKRPRPSDAMNVKEEIMKEEEEEETFMEPETIISEGEVKQEVLDNWTKGSDPVGQRKYHSWSKLPESDMSLEKVQCLVMTSQIQVQYLHL